MALSNHTGWGGLYGTHPLGWGEPGRLSAPTIDGDGVVPDDGGVVLTLRGAFAPGRDYTVTVGGITAHSSVMGQADHCRSTDGTTLPCLVPGGLAPGPHDVVVGSDVDGTTTALDQITVVRRMRHLKTYEFARLFPRSVYRDRGPVDPENTPVLD